MVDNSLHHYASILPVVPPGYQRFVDLVLANRLLSRSGAWIDGRTKTMHA